MCVPAQREEPKQVPDLTTRNCHFWRTKIIVWLPTSWSQPYVNSFWLPGTLGCSLPCHVCSTFNLLSAVSTKHFLDTQFPDGAYLFSPWVSRVLHWSGGTQADDLYIGAKLFRMQENRTRGLSSCIFVSPMSSWIAQELTRWTLKGAFVFHRKTLSVIGRGSKSTCVHQVGNLSEAKCRWSFFLR